MKTKNLYILLCIVGTLLPYTQFVPFFMENGFDLALMMDQAFTNRISSGFTFDLTISVLALIIFILSESRRLNIKLFWLPIASIFLVGVSLGLPMFLYQREIAMDK